MRQIHAVPRGSIYAAVMVLPAEPQRIARLVRANVDWLAHSRFEDYLVASGAAASSLPLVGRYLEPLSGMAALSVWGARYLPDFVSAAQDRVRQGEFGQRADASALVELMTAGLRDIVSAQALAEPWPSAPVGVPWRNAARLRRSVYRTSVPYGDQPGQLLDVRRRADLSGPAPVLVFVPGGAWIFGRREVQGHDLMAHMAGLGWVCLSLQYRTSPRFRWPRQILDVKAAIAWARTHAGQFGGDTGFVAVAGSSAGGHMASLAGLTVGDPTWQTEVGPSANTSVDAVVSVYGRYDWEDRSTAERARFMEFLERVVVKRRQERKPTVFRDASPVARVHADAPPFLVLHGSRDMIIPVNEARVFVERLRGVSRQPVGYVELPGAGHGFDLVDGVRTGAAVRAIGMFLTQVHQNRPIAPIDAVG